MTTIVYKKDYPAPPIDRREALRYVGVRGDAPELASLLEWCIEEAAPHLSYKLCYAYYPLTRVNFSLDLGFTRVESRALAEHLEGCSHVVVMAATLGSAYDRLLAKAAKVSPTRALLLDGLGAERIEALCDLFCEEEGERQEAVGAGLTRRFSAGYGDLPLGLQASIFGALDCGRSIGLTLNESMLMSPQKSVTAIIGIKKVKK